MDPPMLVLESVPSFLATAALSKVVRVDFPSLPGTNVDPLVPALEKIWADSMGQSLADFNFR